MNFSTFQLNIFSFIEDPNAGSAIVQAVAGSGKTTTIVEACNHLEPGLSVLFLAFNKNIVAELKSRLPNTVKCQTFNGCGWGAWFNYVGRRNIKLDANKTFAIMKDRFQKEDFEMYSSFVKRMVSLAKSEGLSPEDNDALWLELADHHCLDLSSEEATFERGVDLAKKTLAESIRIADSFCDYDDQIYMPYITRGNFPTFDVIFIDEAQDTSKVQIQLLRRMLKPGGRLIAVGDYAQAIYGFRGADSESMNNIKEAFNATTLPLSISYRCWKAIIREAQKYMPDIEAFEDAPEGVVEELAEYTIANFTKDDAVLCRNNAPLIKFAYQVIPRGLGINFLGRDLGGNLKSLINQMEAGNLQELEEKLQVWLAREVEKAEAKGQEDKVQALTDKVSCIEVFINYLPESRRTIPDLLAAIESLFNREGGLTLSSAHRAKGKEWHRVFILDPHLMPSPYAKKEWMKIQERNLTYVAITRAKEYLGYINSDCWKDQPNMVIPERTAPKSAPAKSVPVQSKSSKKPGGMLKISGGHNPFGKSGR